MGKYESIKSLSELVEKFGHDIYLYGLSLGENYNGQFVPNPWNDLETCDLYKNMSAENKKALAEYAKTVKEYGMEVYGKNDNLRKKFTSWSEIPKPSIGGIDKTKKAGEKDSQSKPQKGNELQTNISELYSEEFAPEIEEKLKSQEFSGKVKISDFISDIIEMCGDSRNTSLKNNKFYADLSRSQKVVYEELLLKSKYWDKFDDEIMKKYFVSDPDIYRRQGKQSILDELLKNKEMLSSIIEKQRVIEKQSKPSDSNPEGPQM